MNKAYSILYQIPSIVISIKNKDLNNYEQLKLQSSDIVSMTIIDNYESSCYPIIRLRLFTDITTVGIINENPDNIDIDMTFEEKLVQINDGDSSREYTVVKGIMSCGLHYKGYIETKNNPYSKYDNYEHGIKRTSDLNNNKKVAIVIYCYNSNVIHEMKSRVTAVHRNASITTVVNNIMDGIHSFEFCPPDNGESYEQIILPNISRIDSLTFLDRMYGIYKTGSQFYSDMFGTTYLTSTSYFKDHYIIHVKSFKSSNESSTTNVDFTNIINANAESVVVKTETNIEQTLNARMFGSINCNEFEVDIEELKNLYKDSSFDEITATNIIHKTKNKFLASMYKTRVEEHMTMIDVSVAGTNIALMKPTTGFNFIFEQPIRGLKIDKLYRIANATHTISNIGSGWFECVSTLQMC